MFCLTNINKPTLLNYLHSTSFGFERLTVRGRLNESKQQTFALVILITLSYFY